MKSIRKAAAWLVLAALIVGMFSGCSKEKDPAVDSTADDTSDTQQITTEADITTEAQSNEPGAVQTRPVNDPTASPLYEISYTNVRLYEMGSGSVWMQAIAEISNAGEATLSLDNAAFNLQNATGETVASKSNVLAYPRMIAPGEKGYFYVETSLPDVAADTALTLDPQVEISKTGAVKQNFTVTDTKISANNLGDLTVTGTMENKTEKSFDSVYTVTILFNDKNVPIGVIPSSAPYSLTAGATAKLQDSAFALPDDITKDSVDSFAVYAYAISAK